MKEQAQSDELKAALKKVFATVCTFIFVRRAKEQLDSQFHAFLPVEAPHENILDEPECQLILDSLMNKDSPERLLEIIEQHNPSVFAKCILARTKKSLDHLKSTIERYRSVFDKLFGGQNQRILLEQVLVVFDNEPEKALRAI